jgi:WhiB family redox-sensing transcriptional regulator
MTTFDTRTSTSVPLEPLALGTPAPKPAGVDDFEIRGPIGDIDWTQFSNCKGKTHLFFAPKAERPQARARREAKARSLCDVCIVRDTCRDYARVNHEYGLWGAESEEERHLAGFTIAAPVGLRSAKYRHLRDNEAPVSPADQQPVAPI